MEVGNSYLVQFPKLGLEFKVNDTVFQIGNFSIKWYGIIIGIGFLLAILYGFKNAKNVNVNSDKLLDAIIWGLIGGVIGARLYYVVFYPGDKYINNPLEIFSIHSGGLAFYGGLIGALIAAVIVAKIKKMRIPALLDLVSLGFLIGQGIGRWGNFVNQEAFGTVTDLPWGMSSYNTGNQPVHPCFLYESLLCIIGFVLLHFFTKKFRKYDGQTFILYVVWYGFIRFFIEGLRTDSLYLFGTGLRVSQVVSGFAVIVGIVLLIVLRNRTTLTGCGSKKIMELRGVVIGQEMTEEAKPEKIGDEDTESTIFGTLTKEERSRIFGDGDDALKAEDTAQTAEEPQKTQAEDVNISENTQPAEKPEAESENADDKDE